MKKKISLALCLVLGCTFLSACSDNSDPFVQKEYTADVSQIEEINIDVRDRQIEVSPSKDDQIHISYYENSKETYTITVSDENGLTMTSVSNKNWTDYIGGNSAAEYRKISLQIPDARLVTLTLSTTNEDISLSSLAVTGRINLSSNGGNIGFGSLAVGNALYLTAKNGDISGTIIGSPDDFAIQSEIKKGESNLPGDHDRGEKTLNVSSNNGDVHIAFANE